MACVYIIYFGVACVHVACVHVACVHLCVSTSVGPRGVCPLAVRGVCLRSV